MAVADNMLVGNFPAYPKILYLPWKCPVTRKDLVGCNDVIFSKDTQYKITVEEKLDGAQCSIFYRMGCWVAKSRDITIFEDRDLIYCSPDTKASEDWIKQFYDLFSWCREHEKQFTKLQKRMDDSLLVVIGEWMDVTHGVYYDSLPSKFIAHEIFSGNTSQYFPSEQARTYLEDCGFKTPELLHAGFVTDYEYLENLTNRKSQFSTTEKIEGVCLKLSRGVLVNRFKMVRPGFIQGNCWNGREMKKNIVLSEKETVKSIPSGVSEKKEIAKNIPQWVEVDNHYE